MMFNPSKKHSVATFRVLLIVLTSLDNSEQLVSSANCSFDDNTFCGWSNIVHNSGDQFKWILHKGASSLYETGPKHDLSGSGFYVYVDTSKGFFYDEKATLKSPEIKGPTALSFHYHMYGDTVETLAVIVRNSSQIDLAVWSQSGNHGNLWKRSRCLWINLNDSYQILLEATASSGITGNIAVDEIRLYDNLTACGDLANSTSPIKRTSANCTFNGSFCGWRDLSSKVDGLAWTMHLQTKPTNNSQLQVNNYVYVASARSSVKKKAFLVSPRFSSPYCMNFLYKISNQSSKLEVFLIHQSNPVLAHMAWECSGCGNGSFYTGRVSLPYSKEYQMLIVAIPSNSTRNDILLGQVSFLPGLCENEDSNAKQNGNCGFEKTTMSTGWCLWMNEIDDVFNWTLASGSTPIQSTGPDSQAGTLCNTWGSSSQPKEGNIRLVCGLHEIAEGRLEIFHSSKWGTICDDGWNAINSRVVCRQLASSGLRSTKQYITSPGKRSIWMDQVACKGHENYISSCSFDGWENHDCSHSEDVWVFCTDYMDITQEGTEGEVRLSGTTKPNQGLVQIYHQNRWGFVCDDYWGSQDTAVVCRQLGYLSGGKTMNKKPVLYSAFFWMDDVACIGNESNLAECDFPGWASHNCGSHEVVMIECPLWLLSEMPTTFGTFIYIEASSPRAPGEQARIASPWMKGDQCMTFDYHMYGASVSCVVIYLRQEGSSTLKPLWVKSRNHGNTWGKTNVTINGSKDKKIYQVVIEGTVGTAWQGDASLDNITFTKGICITFNSTASTYYLSVRVRDNVFKFSSMAELLHFNGWSSLMKYQMDLSTNASMARPHYFYLFSTSSHGMISTKFVLNPQNFPIELIYLGNDNKNRIYTIRTESPWRYEFRLKNDFNKKCCNLSVSSFGVQSAFRYDQKPAICGPGWYKIGSSCFLFMLEEQEKVNWLGARLQCQKENSVLARFDSLETQKALGNLVSMYKKNNLRLYTGFKSQVKWQWVNGDEMLSNFWGPGEPSGNEYCGTLLNANSWNRRWHGWLWNDESCGNSKHYICEETNNRVNPVAIYPMNNVSGLKEASPQPLQNGRAYYVILQTGPFGNQNGSYYLNGSSGSFILLPNNGGLDTRYSMTILAWILLEQHPGCIFCYQSGLGLWISSSLKLEARFVYRGNQPHESVESMWESVPLSWNYVAISYDYKTGLAKLWIDNATVASRNVGAKRQTLTESDLRLGSAFKDSHGCKGRIAGLQVYDVALTDEQIRKFGRRSTESAPVRCRSGFIPVRGKCFFISSTTVRGTDAKEACKKMNAALAVIDREYVKKDLWNTFYRLAPSIKYYFIGMEPIQVWSDRDKKNQINNSMWEQGYPKRYPTPLTHAVFLTSSSKLINSLPTEKMEGAVCQKQEMSIAYQCATSSSSTIPDSNSSFAVDAVLTKCFTSKQEDNPYLMIKLKKETYIYKVVVTKNKDCCTKPYSNVEIVTTDETKVIRSRCGSLLPYGVEEVMEFVCEPPIKANQVVITSKAENTSLVVCEVEVYTVDEIHGVFREVWYGERRNRATLKDCSVFGTKPRTSLVIKSIMAPRDFTDVYAQRLTTFLQIPALGNYTFYIACDDVCELWYSLVTEEEISFIPSRDKKLLAKTDRSTWPKQWQKYSSQSSAPILLYPCFLYQLQVFMFEESAKDHVTVGMKYPKEEAIESPINDERLYRTMTGKRSFQISIGYNSTVTINVGSKIIIDGHYKYCCHGIYCPNCPLKVLLDVNNTETILSESVAMSCKKINFTFVMTLDLLPGDYPVKVSYDFVNVTLLHARRHLGKLRITAVFLEECRFTRGLCSWLTNKIEPHQAWDVGRKTVAIAGKDHYTCVNGTYTSWLSSDFLPWEPFHAKTGLCLEFLYHMPNKSSSTLSIFIATADREELVWNLTGYHGNGWNEGRVSWDGKIQSKVTFEGRGVLNGTVNIAITEIKITTQPCLFNPAYANPRFSCKSNEFQCKNKRCIKKEFYCDGDEHCIDGSDELGCDCPSSKFRCLSGECIPLLALCDKRKDCKDATDERNCGYECKDQFQCIDGSCIPWSSTCKRQGHCQEASHNPIICGNGKCPLNNIGCESKPNQTETSKDLALCRTFTVPCSFENGLCGLEEDRQSDFLWSINSAKTPTAATGPKFDHTTLSPKGQYIFLEASDHKAGDKARMISGWLNANETLCLQFWYHMNGEDIGSLKVILKTNQSESLIWEKTGNVGNKWMFAQTTLEHNKKYKFIFEGTTTGGKEGDIALDDVTLFNGACRIIYSQTSPECYFENDKCGWQSDDDKWTIDIYDFKNHKGYFLKLASANGIHLRTISSPEINTEKYGWKCIQFWYFLGQEKPAKSFSPSLHVSTKSLKNVQISLRARTLSWSFVQLQIPDERKLKVLFTGHFSLTGFGYILLDDISLSQMNCLNIAAQNDNYQGTANCSCSHNWCCWTTKYNNTQNNTWSIISRDDLESYQKRHNLTTFSGTKPSNDLDFEVVLRSNTSVRVSGHHEPLKSFSLCLWLKTSKVDFTVEYQYPKGKRNSSGIRVVFTAASIHMTVMETTHFLSGNFSRLHENDWHFFCFLWYGSRNKSSIYIDGDKASTNAQMHHGSIPAMDKGTLTVGYKGAEYNKAVKGTLAGLNIWSYSIISDEIKSTSYGCEINKEGDIVSWSLFFRRNDNSAVRAATCKGVKDNVLAVKGLSSSNLLSPVYIRSTSHSHKCFKFRYMMHGPGVQSLQVRLLTTNDTSMTDLIWIDKDNTKAGWRYGQVPVTALNSLRVVLQGHIGEEPGYIILGISYMEDETCNHLPEKSLEAFNQNISTAPGFISSPYYPGHYIPNIHCTWQITAPLDHVIRLMFNDFITEDHSTCSADYVEVFDGSQEKGNKLGRFCGFVYPEFLETSTNHMTVIFHSNSVQERRGFKSYYTFLKDIGSKCSGNQEGCPSGCKCSVINITGISGTERRLVVEGDLEILHGIPKNIPKETAALMFKSNHISTIKENVFADLPNLLYVDVSNNIISNIEIDAFANMTSTETIRMNSNFIRTLPPHLFKDLKSLKVLDLGKNLIGQFNVYTLKGLRGLKVLSLRYNKIQVLPSILFYDVQNLTHLYLQDNLISSLPDGVFRFLPQLQFLNLGNNRIKKLTRKSFLGLGHLNFLILSNNKLASISTDAFDDLQNLKYLKLDVFIYCCYAEKAIKGLTCESPASNGFSSCDDLMKNETLRVFVWILGMMALFGNIFVIGWRAFTNSRDGQVHSLILTNLAVADFLMGVYLLIIAVMDAKWKGEYFKHDIEWRSGIGCQITGVISMLSSESSVIFLTIVTADRLICIVFPFPFKRLTRRKAFWICAGTWFFGLVVSIIPISGLEYFKKEKAEFGFYGRSSVCLPIQLSPDRPAGWEYSVVFFIAFNFAAFTFMLFAYIAIFVKVRQSSRAVRSTAMNRESSLAKKVIFIIFTDFACWMPVIVIGVLSLTGSFYDPSNQVYVWIAVFVLPVNSSINPFLYTFSNSQICKRGCTQKISSGCHFKEMPVVIPLKDRNQTLPGTIETERTNIGYEDAGDLEQNKEKEKSNKSTSRQSPHDQVEEKHRIILVEKPNILKHDKRDGMGYVVAMVETGEVLNLRLIKYFSPSARDAWANEVSIVSEFAKGINQGHHPNILPYRWHSLDCGHQVDASKIKLPHIKEKSLICYDFVSSTSLQEFLDSESPLTFNMVCSLAIDVISAISYMESCGICNSEINPSSILIGPSTSQNKSIRAVLANFSNATKVEVNKDGCCSYNTDVMQFGQLLKVLLNYCGEFNQYTEINDVVYLCLQERSKNQTSLIKQRLIDALSASEESWDTCL